MITDTVPPHIVQIMGTYRGQAIRRILSSLRRRGILRQHNAIALSDVPARDRAVFAAQAARASRCSGASLKLASDDMVWGYLRSRLAHYRKNALRRGFAFSITTEDLLRIYRRSGGRCEVTGVSFDLHKFGTSRAPFSPSVDRIDSDQGYAPGNIRLVCQMVNLAMNVWGAPAMAEFQKRLAAGPKAPAAGDISTVDSTQCSCED